MTGPKKSNKRLASACNVAASRANATKRQKLNKFSELQPITIDASQPSLPIIIDVDTQRETPPTSPRRAMIAASQGIDFETQVHDSIPEDEIFAPVEASEVATAASEAVDKDAEEPDFDPRMVDNFEGIDWGLLPRYMKPLRTQKQKKSWVYDHGYRLTLRRKTNRIVFLCRICHKRKAAGVRFSDATDATSTAVRHLKKDHGITKDGKLPLPQLLHDQKSLDSVLRSRVPYAVYASAKVPPTS
jgi:hypothetical protein